MKGIELMTKRIMHTFDPLQKVRYRNKPSAILIEISFRVKL